MYLDFKEKSWPYPSVDLSVAGLILEYRPAIFSFFRSVPSVSLSLNHPISLAIHESRTNTHHQVDRWVKNIFKNIKKL